MSYLCNRNRETKIANDKVPWMSGLVSGLQTVYGSSNLPGTSKNKTPKLLLKVFRSFCYRELFAHSIKYHSLNSYSLLIKD